MRYFSALTPVLVITLLLSACGAGRQASPTMNAVDLQSTINAAAFTVVAETQAAIPTATPSQQPHIPIHPFQPLPYFHCQPLR